MRLSIPAMLFAFALTSCGGGGAAVQPVAGTPAQGGAAGAGSSIVSTIVVPGPQTAQTSRRSPQYVSASTLGLKVTVTDVPPANGTASFNATTSVYALGVGFNQVVIPTPATAAGHTEDLTYVVYTQAPVAGSIPAGAKALGYGLTTGFVVAPGQNTNNVQLAGVVDGFPAPLVELGTFGMMSAAPPALLGVQSSAGFGGAAVPSGNPIMLDGGLNNIGTAAGAPWPVVGAVPAAATTAATGIPVTIAETAGVAGCSVGNPPHLQLQYNGGALGTSAALVKTSDTIGLIYDGNGGVGWFATVSAKAQTQTLTYTLQSIGVTAVPSPANPSDWSCSNQTLSFSQPNETALVTVTEHAAQLPYTVTVSPTVTATQSCAGLVNVYAGNNTLPANLITPGVPKSLGAAGTQFTIQLIAAPGGYFSCPIEIQDANAVAGVTGGAVYPGGTTYVQALLPSGETFITVP